MNYTCSILGTTQQRGNYAVVMSMDYYNSLMETIYLSRSPANAAHLNKSIAQYNAGQTTERGLLE